MKQLKKPLDFKSQILQLKSQGMVVQDDQRAEDILRKANYYRFTGYALQFRVSPQQSDYIPGTNFDFGLQWHKPNLANLLPGNFKPGYFYAHFEKVWNNGSKTWWQRRGYLPL